MCTSYETSILLNLAALKIKNISRVSFYFMKHYSAYCIVRVALIFFI